MFKFLAVVCLLWAQSFATKVSLTFTSCDSYMSEEAVALMKPEGCLLLQYPERDSKDVAVLTDGDSESGSYTWNASLGRDQKNSLKIRADEGNIHVTFYNHETEKQQSIKNLKNRQVFEVNDGIISDDALSMSLEEVARMFDADGKGGDLEFHERQSVKNKKCKDIYRFQNYCKEAKKKGHCKDWIQIRRWCRKTCGLCPNTTTKTTKLPLCHQTVSTPVPSITSSTTTICSI